MKSDNKRGDKRPDDVEVEPDAWERFERTVDKMLRTPPKPRLSKDRGHSGTLGRKKERGGS